MIRAAIPLALALALAAPPAGAHPHVFVEARVEIVTEPSGAVTGVRLTWVYDDFFSLVLTSELGLDADGDLQLTPEEEAALAAYVLDWPEDFGGDLAVSAGGAPVLLGPRDEAAVAFVAGRVEERHLRPLAEPVPAGVPVAVQVFDPFYYVAYEVRGEIAVTGGADCAIAFRRADLNAAYALVDELLYGRPASDVGPDEAFPEVGHMFADTVEATCGA